ncbi:MAG: hypothetical protein Q9199_002618 [Rusavskia elegans]
MAGLPRHMPRPNAETSLSDLEQLSPSVYLSQPTKHADSLGVAPAVGAVHFERLKQAISDNASVPEPPSQAPKIIVLCSWMSAHPTHVLKYVQGYRSRYPASRILVIQSTPPDLFYRRASTQQHHLAPAMSAILSSCSINSDAPEIILHVFSNGGSHQARNLLLAYRRVTSAPFPPHVTIFDSCPGRATFRRSVLALSSALPPSWFARLILLGLIYAVVSVYWIIFVPLSLTDPIERVRQTLNSRTIMGRETRRCYIYSEADSMVGWRDVEAHARSAVENGFVVQREKYGASEHCSHAIKGGMIRKIRSRILSGCTGVSTSF